jgi:hypothetical protein
MFTNSVLHGKPDPNQQRQHVDQMAQYGADRTARRNREDDLHSGFIAFTTADGQ